jgi:hypothetical protein
MVRVRKSKGSSLSLEPLLFKRSPIEKRKIPVPTSLEGIDPLKNKMDTINRRHPEKKRPPFSVLLPKGKILSP